MRHRTSLEYRERNFLEACGFDLSRGFWSDDVEHWKQKEPELYNDYVRYAE